MSNKRNHLRVANPNEKNQQQSINVKTIMLTSALISVSGFVALELFKFLLSRSKQIMNPQNSVPQQNQLSLPQTPNAPAQPPGMFQSPYSSMHGGFMQPQNPMLMGSSDSDEPPKWFTTHFEQFKEEYEKRLSGLEAQTKKPHLTAVQNPSDDDDYDDYEDDETA